MAHILGEGGEGGVKKLIKKFEALYSLQLTEFGGAVSVGVSKLPAESVVSFSGRKCTSRIQKHKPVV